MPRRSRTSVPSFSSIALVSFTLLAFFPAGARSFEGVEDLNGDLPFRMEDATPTKAGEFQVQFSSEFERGSGGESLGELLPGVQYGFAPYGHAEVKAPFRLGPEDRTGSGDLELRALFDPLRDRIAVALEADLPTGENRRGTEPLVDAIFSQETFSERARAHVNVLWRRLGSPAPEERRSAVTGIVGETFAINDRFLVGADFVREPARERGEVTSLGEIGAVARIGKEIDLSLSIGTGLDADSPRFRSTFGIQYSP